jgi:uncharacterized membrane protein YdjX (TVP38/TMEM64 family)
MRATNELRIEGENGERSERAADYEPRRGARRILSGALKLSLLGLLTLTIVYALVSHKEWFHDPARVRAAVLSWGPWAPVAYLLMYAVGPSLLLPGAVMTIAAGLAFGAVRGAIYAVIGAIAGALAAFATGRFLGQGFVRRMVGGRFEALFARMNRHGFPIIFYLRIFPIIPYNALNLIAGASPISFRDYFWATILGIIPGTVLFACLGNELWHPTSTGFMVTLALIGLCFASAEVYRRRAALRL